MKASSTAFQFVLFKLCKTVTIAQLTELFKIKKEIIGPHYIPQRHQYPRSTQAVRTEDGWLILLRYRYTRIRLEFSHTMHQPPATESCVQAARSLARHLRAKEKVRNFFPPLLTAMPHTHVHAHVPCDWLPFLSSTSAQCKAALFSVRRG